MKIRIHLRDTGALHRYWKISKGDFGYNIYCGHLVLAIRENDGVSYRRGKFFELEMGRAMRAERIRLSKMTNEEISAEEEARHKKYHPHYYLEKTDDSNA